MLKNYKNDALVSFLIERCSLTAAQLDTLIISRSGRNLEEKVGLRDRKKVSKGAFIRTLRQGQGNVESALYTLILLEYLGLVDSKELFALGRIGELISRVKDSNPSVEAIGKLLTVIEEFVENFSSKDVFFNS